MKNSTLRSTAMLAIVVGLLISCSTSREEVSMKTVATEQGQLKGVQSPFDANTQVFRGIPFAAPPTGANRWQPPQPPAAWTGVKSAEQFSASCYQQTHTSGFVWRREDFAISEDCLYLNVWTPEDAERLPVMVWFHGGAHTSGQGHSTIFDGTRLSREGIVVVTINYRLGPFGFLAHPWFAEESDHGAAGNYGLMDKIAALQWVQRNIQAFGGNPDNVTIFGQSAGSQSVCSLMASHQAHGLFHRAIGQSAACFSPQSGKDLDGRIRGTTLVDALRATSAADLRQQPAADILKMAATTGWANSSRIVVDGHVLSETQQDTFRRGAQAQVPLLVGSLSGEGVELIPKNETLTVAGLDEYLSRTFGDDAQTIKALYSALPTPGDQQHAIATDMFMAFGMRRWAEYHSEAGNDTYLYYMDHTPPAFHLYMPDQPELTLPGGPRSAGAYHSGDLAYVFGNVGLVGLDWDDSDQRLSDAMVGYWTSFARNGTPNSSATAHWPAFNTDRYATQRLNDPITTEHAVLREKLDVMARAFPR